VVCDGELKRIQAVQLYLFIYLFIYLLVVHLTTLSVTEYFIPTNDCILVANEFEVIWKERAKV
jgi:hypothetical protein